VVLQGLSTPEDPSFIFGTQLSKGGANWVGWNSGAVDQLRQLNEQALAASSHSDRMKYYTEVQQIAVDQAVYGTIALIPTLNGSSAKVTNYQVGADAQWILTEASVH
jgi:ABC-type transport system substrate-binding protein